MDNKTYEATRDKEFRGRKVKTLIELSNGWCRIPPRTVATVERKYNGLHLLSDPCPTCGVKVAITHVSYRDVDFVDQPTFSEVHKMPERIWVCPKCRFSYFSACECAVGHPSAKTIPYERAHSV